MKEEGKGLKCELKNATTMNSLALRKIFKIGSTVIKLGQIVLIILLKFHDDRAKVKTFLLILDFGSNSIFFGSHLTSRRTSQLF